MRAVNLIPPEQRRGERAPLRTGMLSYAVVALLAVALLAVTGLVLTGNQIKEREAEVASLEVREADARARAESLSAFSQFASLSQARFQTVSSLAQSRFDWERVLRELALVIPEDIWLVELSGTATPEVDLEGATDVSLRNEIAGPALTLIGCGSSQEAVASFIEALKDIDGVTRVGVASSEQPSSGGSASEGSDDCRTADFISRFEIVAAFDEVAVAVPDASAVPAPAPAPEGSPPAEGEEPSGSSADASGGVVSGVAR